MVTINNPNITTDTEAATFYARPATGNSIDDTAALQHVVNLAAAVNGTAIALPGENYAIKVTDDGTGVFVGLELSTNISLILTGVILTMEVTNSTVYSIIRVLNCDNVKIVGGVVIGDREFRIDVGEHGHGIDIRNSTNVSVDFTHVTNCFGDGFYIGHSSVNGLECENVKIANCISDNNRRQGLSVTACIGGMAKNCIFRNTNGVNPQSGIDLEPNAGFVVSNFKIHGGATHDNAGKGVVIYGDGATDNIIDSVDIYNNAGWGGIQLNPSSNNTVQNCNIHNNTNRGISLFAQQSGSTNVYQTIKNNHIHSNGLEGVEILGTATDSICENHKITDNVIENNGRRGILVAHSANTIINNNYLNSNTDQGIHIQRVASAGTIVSNNIILNSDTVGIDLSDGVIEIVISQNKIKYSGTNGLILRSSSLDCRIKNNIIDSSSQTSNLANPNIRVAQTSHRNYFIGNVVKKGIEANKPDNGIQIDAGCEDCIIEMNTLTNSGETNLVSDSGTNTIIQNNVGLA